MLRRPESLRSPQAILLELLVMAGARGGPFHGVSRASLPQLPTDPSPAPTGSLPALVRLCHPLCQEEPTQHSYPLTVLGPGSTASGRAKQTLQIPELLGGELPLLSCPCASFTPGSRSCWGAGCSLGGAWGPGGAIAHWFSWESLISSRGRQRGPLGIGGAAGDPPRHSPSHCVTSAKSPIFSKL